MSFILDALKKSENERQHQASAEFAGVPTRRDPPGTPRWLWVFALLLAINLAVLLGLWLRPDTNPMAEIVVSEIDAPSASGPTFEDRVKEARRDVPARQPEQETASSPAPGRTTPDIIPVQRPAVTRSTALPTFIEVITDGAVVLPDLHLDIHVFSEVPEDRFVFINMSKQREKSQLREGPVVEEITPDGVVLGYQGTTFLLPRD